MASIQFKNKHLRPLIQWLNVPLHGLPARLRGRFVKTLQDRMQEIDESRVALLKELCDRDEKGEPIMEEGDHYKLNPDALKKLNEKYKEMMEEPYVIDVLDSNRAMLVQVKDLIVNGKYEMGTDESQDYDEVASILEAVDLNAAA